jgi:hypothetical protein
MILAKLAPEQIHTEDTEYENEKYKEGEKYSDIIHGPQHYEQLTAQVRHEPDQL